jgi:two-component system NarL family sensor kinase
MARDPSQRERQRLRRLVELQEHERTLLAYDIHDGFVQDVVGAQIGIDTVLDQIADSSRECVPALLQVRSLIRKSIDEARRVIGELRPVNGDHRGLIDSIQSLVGDAAAHQLNVQFTYPDDFPNFGIGPDAHCPRVTEQRPAARSNGPSSNSPVAAC